MVQRQEKRLRVVRYVRRLVYADCLRIHERAAPALPAREIRRCRLHLLPHVLREAGPLSRQGSQARRPDLFSTAHSKSNVSHTGLVEKVDGSKVYTIEGNTSDQVARRSYYLSDSYIVGYGRPAYDAEPGNANTGSQTSSNGTTSEVTYTVVAGDTLSKIAAKYGTTYQKLAAYNGITNPNIIRVGQKIKIRERQPLRKPTPSSPRRSSLANGATAQTARSASRPLATTTTPSSRPSTQHSRTELQLHARKKTRPEIRAGFSCFIGPRAASIWRRPFCKPSCLCSGLRNHRHHDPPETSAGQDLQQSQPRNCAETHTPKDHADR